MLHDAILLTPCSIDHVCIKRSVDYNCMALVFWLSPSELIMAIFKQQDTQAKPNRLGCGQEIWSRSTKINDCIGKRPSLRTRITALCQIDSGCSRRNFGVGKQKSTFNLVQCDLPISNLELLSFLYSVIFKRVYLTPVNERSQIHNAVEFSCAWCNQGTIRLVNIADVQCVFLESAHARRRLIILVTCCVGSEISRNCD